MTSVRILADDLTGALDSAVRFCGDAGPLPVMWRTDAVSGGDGLALSAGTRALDPDAAALRAGRAAQFVFDTRHLCFMKIDSLLRGHVAAELAAILRGPRFDAVVLAPAYPALGRVTREGRQYLRVGAGDCFEQTGPDLFAELAYRGIACFSSAERVRTASGPAVWIADAGTQDDLQDIVETARGWDRRTLWCGTGGLAGALAMRPEPAFQPRAGSLLIVCGTNHDVALSQMSALARYDRNGVVACRPGAEVEAVDLINRRLAAGNWVALQPDLVPTTPEKAAPAIESMLSRLLPRIDRPEAIFVMGGETLQACCRVLDANALTVHGSAETGIPVSILSGGIWYGTTVYSKSGAFGDATTVAALVRRSPSPGAALRFSVESK